MICGQEMTNAVGGSYGRTVGGEALKQKFMEIAESAVTYRG
jgi:hypothetical protein